MALTQDNLWTVFHILAAAFVLALTAACGKVELADDRTRGDINVRPQKVAGSEDAVAGAPAPVSPDEQGPGEEESPGEDEGAAPDLQKLLTGAGLRNYEQINATMATVTGVPAATPAVRTLFNDQLATSLPTDNDIKSFMGSQQVAVYKLAVSYCEALVTNTTLRANVFGTFNFAGTPAASLNAAGKAAIADALISKFWGKDLESLPAHQASTTLVVGLIDQLLQGKSTTTVAVTPVIVIGACAATLASAPVTIL